MQKPTITLLLLALLAVPTAAQWRQGSIYNPDRGPIGMVADKTARRAGDLVTVLIAETQALKNEESANLNKQTTLDYALSSFQLKPGLFNVLPDIAASSSDQFQGSANYEKKGSFTARITAMVIDVLPNGNLVLQGRREIQIDGEVKVIEFSGVVRSYDIQANNTIESELVADARVSYLGEGTLTDHTNRSTFGGMLHGFISWLWPF